MRPVTAAVTMFVWADAFGRPVASVAMQGYRLPDGRVVNRYLANVPGLPVAEQLCDRFACAERKVNEQLRRLRVRATARRA